MGEREVDFQGRDVRVRYRQAEALEKILRYSVVSLVFRETSLPPRGQSAFASVPGNQTQSLECREMVEGGRRADAEGVSDEIQGSSLRRGLASSHGEQGLHLPPAQSFEELHGNEMSTVLLKMDPNF